MIECQLTARRAPRTHRRALPTLLIGLSLLVGTNAWAEQSFQWSGRAIHPACVHALAMTSGDAIPVTTAVSLEGCMASERAQSAPTRVDGFYTFENEALLGEGSFGYTELSTLDNGLIILAIARTDGTGARQLSVAAVDLADRPMLRNREVTSRRMLEMIGEVWIANLDLASVKTNGNVIQISTGAGNRANPQTIDLSRIAKARNRKK
jgi:hypothetical protein